MLISLRQFILKDSLKDNIVIFPDIFTKHPCFGPLGCATINHSLERGTWTYRVQLVIYLTSKISNNQSLCWVFFFFFNLLANRIKVFRMSKNKYKCVFNTSTHFKSLCQTLITSSFHQKGENLRLHNFHLLPFYWQYCFMNNTAHVKGILVLAATAKCKFSLSNKN